MCRCPCVSVSSPGSPLPAIRKVCVAGVQSICSEGLWFWTTPGTWGCLSPEVEQSQSEGRGRDPLTGCRAVRDLDGVCVSQQPRPVQHARATHGPRSGALQRGREPRPGFQQTPTPPELSAPEPPRFAPRARRRPPPRRLRLCLLAGPISAGRQLLGSRARPLPRVLHAEGTRHRPQAFAGRRRHAGLPAGVRLRRSGRAPELAPRGQHGRGRGTGARLCPHGPPLPWGSPPPTPPAPRNNTPVHAPPSARTSVRRCHGARSPSPSDPEPRGQGPELPHGRRGRSSHSRLSATLAA